MAKETGVAREYKFSVLGSSGIGKSALTIRLITDNFPDCYDPTIEDSYIKKVLIDNEPALIDVLDTAGREEFSIFHALYAHYSDAFLIVYSIISRVTFEEAAMLREKVLREKDYQETPMVIVGNKCDLEKHRQVTKEEGIKFAKECGVPFFETSAKTKINNEECFYQLVREMRKLRRKKEEEEEEEDLNKSKKKKKHLCRLL